MRRQLYTKNAGQHPVFCRGPSLGFDWGGAGQPRDDAVYNLPSTDAIYQRFGGVSGSAYVVAGVSMTVVERTKYRARSDPHRCWRTVGLQCRLSEVHHSADLEPLLIFGLPGFMS